MVRQRGHTVLEVEVTDDGTGFAAGARAGTGLRSMREMPHQSSLGRSSSDSRMLSE